MGNTWVTDMSHFDYRDDEVDELPVKALKLWGYFGAIIEASLNKPPFSTATGLPCRRRPGRILCTGVIEAELHPNGNQLHWWCPICADNGHISNWEGTRWGPSGGLKKLTPDEIQGTIEWDDEKDGELPKIVTSKRSCTWDELGRELMTYEGFRISIKTG